MDNRIPQPQMLEGLSPVGDLDQEKRFGLAQRGQLGDLRYGQRLDASAEHRWLVYVMEGSVNLVTSSGSTSVAAGSTRARQPLFSEGRFQEYAVASGSAVVLRLDNRLYGILHGQQSQSGYDVEETELDETESALFAEVYAACQEEKLELPALPEVAVKIQAAMKDPDIDIKRLSSIVSLDIAITAGLIRAASSAAYGVGNPMKSVRDAIVRLGLVAARRLALTIAMQQVFRSNSPVLKRRMHELWDRSVHVSVLSFLLARQCKGLDAEQALLAGLLHDVGAVPILDYIGRNHPEATDEEVTLIIEKLHGVVGEIVFASWGMESGMSMVVRESGNWLRDHGGAPDYCDVVTVARLYHLHQSDPEAAVPRFHEVPAFTHLDLPAPNEEGKLDLIENAAAEREEMMAVIQGKA
ncbi:MAG: HDOD domain-containing protein [Thioalkalivibrio sp.]|nr:HDOD domain-containing protein [Thioalkalivibrio sp.]